MLQEITTYESFIFLKQTGYSLFKVEFWHSQDNIFDINTSSWDEKHILVFFICNNNTRSC